MKISAAVSEFKEITEKIIPPKWCCGKRGDLYKSIKAEIEIALRQAYEKGIESERERISETFFPSNYPELNINRPIEGMVLWNTLKPPRQEEGKKQ